jgi:hypothetical protein
LKFTELDEEDAVKYKDPIQNMVQQLEVEPKHICWREAINKFEDAPLRKFFVFLCFVFGF